MRVLFIPSWYPSNKNPFGGSFIKDLAIDLSSNEIAIDVAAFHYGYSNFNRTSYELKKDGHLVEHHFSGWTFPKLNTFFQHYWIRKCEHELDKIVAINSYNFIHAHDYVGLFLANYLSKKYNIPIIASLHHSDIMMNEVPSWRKGILIDSFSQLEKIIVPSKALKDGIIKYFGKYEIQIIPNYIDEHKILKKAKLDTKPVKFVSVGALDSIKNHLETIQYFKDYEGKLHIYGEGIKRKEIVKYINRNNLEKKVFLKGNLAHELLLNSLNKYDALISTSKYETFGLGILEALSSGLPVICKNKFGPKDFINERNGVFIEEGFSLTEFAKTYHRFNSNKISTEVISKFNKPMIIKEYITLYNDLKNRVCVV